MDKTQVRQLTVTLVQSFDIAANGRDVTHHERGDSLQVPEPIGLGLVRDGFAVKGEIAESQLPEPKQIDESLPFAHTPKKEYRPVK